MILAFGVDHQGECLFSVVQSSFPTKDMDVQSAAGSNNVDEVVLCSWSKRLTIATRDDRPRHRLFAWR